MHIAIVGAGGVGSYYGARLQNNGVDISFVTRGRHLEAMQKKGLHVKHDNFEFKNAVTAIDLETLLAKNPKEYDALILLTKAIETKEIAKKLSIWCKSNTPYIISLQNGVENEEILASLIDKRYIIGGLCVKIGAHIIEPGIVHAVGMCQTILGSWDSSLHSANFLAQFSKLLDASGIPIILSEDIRLELWKKLVINNGVNAICALLEKKTGDIMSDTKLSTIVYGLMQETAVAAKQADVTISKLDVDEMFELIKNFDSIKPSMLVDRENKRALELEEICGVVIKNSEAQCLDAPYTRTISTLLETICKDELKG